jgi:hypothetical protein
MKYSQRQKELIEKYEEITINNSEIKSGDIITLEHTYYSGKTFTRFLVTDVKYTFLHHHIWKVIGINLDNDMWDDILINDENKYKQTNILRMK